MTLKDLFMQVRFDDLIPSLLEQDENTQNSICSFREAFDLLRMMEPDQDFKGEVVIQWSKTEEGEEPWIKVCHLDNEWEKQLAKEVVLKEDVQLSNEELAGNPLSFHNYVFDRKVIEEFLGLQCVLYRMLTIY